MLEQILAAVWFFLPAYFANGSAVIIGKLFGKHIIPFHKELFGEGKTIQGFFGAVLIASVIGFLQGNILLGFLLGLGAMTGDLIKSFFKRRLGIRRGASLPIADQLDFVMGGLLLASLVAKISWSTIAILLILTPAFHLTANVIAWKLKLKKEWW